MSLLRYYRRLAAAVAVLALGAPVQGQQLTESFLDGFAFRNLGPFRTGAWITGFAVPDGTGREHWRTFYVATRNGGVWKTENNGTTFRPIFDGVGPLSIGAVALAPSAPEQVWVGTGESYSVRYSYAGDGVYRSPDGGRTWAHLGLEKTQHISAIVVDPRDPDRVFVAAMGRLHGPNPERGVFRTSDGGRTWKKVLFVDDRTGVIDLVMDPSNADVLYAATYENERRAWNFELGGAGSGIYKSADGGSTWKRLTKGLPTGRIGRIGLDIYRADPKIVYAVVENGNLRPGDDAKSMRVSGGRGEVYRSDDAGESWRMMNDPETNVGGKAPYSFNVIRVDPANDQQLYVSSDALLMSSDGGRTWSGGWANRSDRFRNMFGDIRTIWIDPQDPQRVFIGSDGGVNITYDGGRTVDFLPNLPIGEVYHVAVDNEDPYNVYVGMQDHESWRGPVNGFAGQVSGLGSWVTVGTGDGMYEAVDPTDSRYVYNTLQFGGQVRVDRKLATMTRIQPPRRPKGEPPYRSTWTTPIVLSPNDPATVYTAAQVVLRSRDRGDTWEEISPDLTTDDQDRINGNGNVQYSTITTVAESPAKAGVIWAGTDDGRVQVTRDDGGDWHDVTDALEAAGAPHNYWVTRVVPSSRDAGTAYVTITGYHRDDYRPFVYRTTDFGGSWQALTADLPDASANVLAEDPHNPSILFLGTDNGLFVTIDGGAHWARMHGNMPVVPVRDVVIQAREHDLVVGTHGRGVFETDITPLEQLSSEVLARDTYLFDPEPKGRRIESGWGNYRLYGDRQVVTRNEPNGVVLDVYHRTAVADTAAIRITDASGETVTTLKVPPEAGLQRVVWNLRTERRRPVAPGEYTATLETKAGPERRTVVVLPDVVVPRH